MPHSDATGETSRLAAVVPMKPPHQSKSRLSDALSGPERAALSLSLLRIVLNATTASGFDRVIVLGGDGRVRRLAARWGAEWTADGDRGLNSELRTAFDRLSSCGWACAYIPGDLPMLTAPDVDAVIDASRGGTLLAMCPATRDGGTNGLVVPCQSQFRPELGQASFARHRKAALSAGLPFTTCDAPGFSLDLDTVDDLLACERIEPGFKQRMLGQGGYKGQ